MRAKQNFEVVIHYHEVDQLPLAVFQQFIEAEVRRLHENRPGIFHGSIELHEVKELAPSEDPVNAMQMTPERPREAR